jgi:cell division protein FtsI/penicillin-binding protein 2
MKKKIKKICESIVNINDYFLLVVVTIFVIFVTIYLDVYNYKKVIEDEKTKNFKLVEEEVERIIKGHEKFLIEISKEL